MDMCSVGGRGGLRRLVIGPAWNFERDDKSAIDFRVNLLLDILRPRRRSGLPALMNLMQLPILDALSEAHI